MFSLDMLSHCTCATIKQRFFRFSDDCKQKQAVANDLINKLLLSKRLLIDHVEALEQCVLQQPGGALLKATPKCEGKIVELSSVQYLAFLFGSTFWEQLSNSKSLDLLVLPAVFLTSSVGIIYGVKQILLLPHKMAAGALETLISTVERFGNCLRRNMVFYNEMLLGNKMEFLEHRHMERCWDSITVAKEVTEIIYEAMRKLESDYPIPPCFTQHYMPIEELRDCENFKRRVTDFSAKNLREFYNIFNYVQSQYFFRLALTICTKPSFAQLSEELTMLNYLMEPFIQEEEKQFKNLANIFYQKQPIDVGSLGNPKRQQQRSGTLTALQDSLIQLSAAMTAATNKCLNLDEILHRYSTTTDLHNKDDNELMQLSIKMLNIEDALSLCADDVQRMILIYNKFLSDRWKRHHMVDNEKSLTSLEMENCQNPDMLLDNDVPQCDYDIANNDDFYAYMLEDRKDVESDQTTIEHSGENDAEILNFEKRITRGKFRPVLRQLKTRINPIRQEMLEKERKVLSAKGFDVDELMAKDGDEMTGRGSSRNSTDASTTNESSNDSDDEGSTDLVYRKRKSKAKQADNYAESRQFLQQKEALNLFQLGLPRPAIVGDEEVVE